MKHIASSLFMVGVDGLSLGGACILVLSRLLSLVYFVLSSQRTCSGQSIEHIEHIEYIVGPIV